MINPLSDVLVKKTAVPPDTATEIEWLSGESIVSAPYIRAIHWYVAAVSGDGDPGDGNITLVIEGRVKGVGGATTAWNMIKTVVATEGVPTFGSIFVSDDEGFGVFNDFRATWVAEDAASSTVAIKFQQER